MLDTQEDLKRDQIQREYRILTNIFNSVTLYREEELTLGRLISQLEFSLNNLHNNSSTWNSYFQNQVNIVDMEYTILMTTTKEYLSEEDSEQVDRALLEIERMTLKRMEEYRPLLEQWELEGYSMGVDLRRDYNRCVAVDSQA